METTTIQTCPLIEAGLAVEADGSHLVLDTALIASQQKQREIFFRLAGACTNPCNCVRMVQEARGELPAEI